MSRAHEQLESGGYRFSHYEYEGGESVIEVWIHNDGEILRQLPAPEDAPIARTFQVVRTGFGDDLTEAPPGSKITLPAKPPGFMRKGPNWTRSRGRGNWPDGFNN